MAHSTHNNDDLLFDYRTLRLVIGVLALGFPFTVIALAGKITTSISASYHEAATRDVFVGFMFIIGALLISYKGHLQGETSVEITNVWKLLVRYQEDVISTVGGLAAILAALFPTACDGCRTDTRAVIHLSGAFILFSIIVYFCLVAFLRSLNQKLLRDDALKNDRTFIEFVRNIRVEKLNGDANLAIRFWNFMTLESVIFQTIATKHNMQSDPQTAWTRQTAFSPEFEKGLKRGFTYVICGGGITATLLFLVVLMSFIPDLVSHSITTFVVETVALAFFGFAWMTASKFRYLSKIMDWIKSKIKRSDLKVQGTSLR